jgi:hypothetical protein
MIGIATSDGPPTIPLFVDAGGYVEISASAYPAPPGVTQGNNRFVANIAVTGIAVTGTNWNPISLSLVLNVVDDGPSLIGNLQFGYFDPTDPQNYTNWKPLPNASFQAGQSFGTQIAWFPTNSPTLYPMSPEDYFPPIYFVAGPDAGAVLTPHGYVPGGGSGGPGGSGILVPGQLFMSPPALVAYWTKPSDAADYPSWFAVSTCSLTRLRRA